MNQLWPHLGVITVRLALSAWVGAAGLFVINGVRLITSGAFDTVARDHIALVRFPAYYLVGAILLSLSLIGLLPARGLIGLPRRRWTTVFALTLLAGLTMLGDYVFVYLPLAEMITPPGSPRPQQFFVLHRASEFVNVFQVALSFAAAIVVALPLRIKQ
jgi:hypothetical protein